MEWMILPLKRYFDFTGRSRRMEYWMFQLFFYGILLLLGLMVVALVVVSRNEDPSTGSIVTIAGVFLLFWLATIIPGIAVTVRRFHDQDLSGWLYLLRFIPGVGGIVIIVFMCLEGTQGPNRFGDDPLDPNNTDAFA